MLLDYIIYGFPMGYAGPVSNTVGIPNHTSGTQFPAQVDAFVRKEMSLGGIVGPFTAPPFTEWAHLSPMKTRPKATGDDRRVITDLTFPMATSVNAFIKKNTAMGLTHSHCLPSVDAVVDEVKKLGPDAHLFTLEVARA